MHRSGCRQVSLIQEPDMLQASLTVIGFAAPGKARGPGPRRCKKEGVMKRRLSELKAAPGKARGPGPRRCKKEGVKRRLSELREAGGFVHVGPHQKPECPARCASGARDVPKP